jgi:hypothetical protein
MARRYCVTVFAVSPSLNPEPETGVHTDERSSTSVTFTDFHSGFCRGRRQRSFRKARLWSSALWRNQNQKLQRASYAPVVVPGRARRLREPRREQAQESLPGKRMALPPALIVARTCLARSSVRVQRESRVASCPHELFHDRSPTRNVLGWPPLRGELAQNLTNAAPGGLYECRA